MQGIILAGGKGTRLRPLTLVTNKHLLPVYHKPMIYYPIEAMQKAGVKEVLLTTGGESIAQFANLLKSGEDPRLIDCMKNRCRPTRRLANVAFKLQQQEKLVGGFRTGRGGCWCR